jgi:Type III restriction enzyme, res subunit
MRISYSAEFKTLDLIMPFTDRMSEADRDRLIEAWRSETDMERRDSLYEQLVEENIFPQDDVNTWERGFYPDIEDPEFLPKLLRKREFQESKQEAIAEKAAKGEDACRSTEDFELTPVQRFVSRLLSPRTPYTSALLYHGVGVGKTCSAVSIAEGYLEAFPRKKVYIVAPPAIQAGFKTTLFNPEDLTIPEQEGESNQFRGCTGTTYLDLTNSTFEKTRTTVEARIVKKINTRYEFFGYTQLYKHIRGILERVPKGIALAERTQREATELRREFSGRVLIIDEAHNLRDLPDETEEDNIDNPGDEDDEDRRGGKRLTPYLQKVLEAAEGMTLVLLTATPMYNSFREIIFLLNLLLKNDKKATLNETDVFYTSGARVGQFRPGGEKLLGRVAGAYISFMRGENPLTFPVRLKPLEEDGLIEDWPTEAPNGEMIPEEQGERAKELPIVVCPMEEDTEAEYQQLTELVMERGGGGLGITNVDLLIQAGNWIFPATSEDTDVLGRIRQEGFDRVFQLEKQGGDDKKRSLASYRTKESDASWLREDRLKAASGKAAFVLEKAKECKGVAFVYSRFVPSGALTLALALEANGYTPWNREKGLLADGIQMEGGRQCALCPLKEVTHPPGATSGHTFTPAKYVLLTGNPELSPNNPAAVRAARARSNVRGAEIKVILGSQVAGEGLDLRFVREIYVYDSWFHLNKLEQVVGRGVRTCSHALLPMNQRNTTIYLLVNRFVNTPEKETIDLYSYRTALNKAVIIGRVTRVLKQNAIDCTLNYPAIHVAGIEPRKVVDGQGREREDVDINDTPFSPLCDWLETCEYECSVKVDIALADTDSSTYDEYAVRWRISQIRRSLSLLFTRRTWYKLEDLENAMSNIPRIMLAAILNDIITSPDFKIQTAQGEGRIVYRNGYYLFQPMGVEDIGVPLAVRMARLPVKRDSYEPRLIDIAALEALKPPKPVVAGPERIEAGGAGAAREDAGGGGGAGVKGVDTSELWMAAIAWAERIAGGTQEEKTPDDIQAEMKRLTEGNTKLLRQRLERMEMVSWLLPVIKDNTSARETYAEVVRQYMWDEFMSTDTQQELLLSEDDTLESVGRHTRWALEEQTYTRIYDIETGELRYFMGTAPASAAVVEVLEQESARDPIRSKPIDTRTTGTQYGFLVSKKNEIIFKIAAPPGPGKKVERGARCSIDSTISYQIGKLVELGKVLGGFRMSDLDLNENALTKVRPFKNSTRACTLLDLVLRWMDLKRVGGKRWFYRPLEAKLLGHKKE